MDRNSHPGGVTFYWSYWTSWGLVICQISVIPAWSYSSQNPRGSELVDLGDAESNPQVGKGLRKGKEFAQSPGACLPCPFSYIHKDPLLEWGSPPRTVSTLHSFPPQSFPFFKEHHLHAATPDLMQKALSLLPFSTLDSVPKKEHRMEWGWEPRPQLPMKPRPD